MSGPAKAMTATSITPVVTTPVTRASRAAIPMGASARSRPWVRATARLAHGPALALAPVGIAWLLTHLAGAVATGVIDVAVMALSGPLILGHFLLTLVLSGLEHHQAFAVLGHPGFKHFVRMRVGRDGRIAAWVIGKDDTLGDGPPEMIDAFNW